MHISLAAEKIIEVGPIAITNTMLVTWIVIGFLVLLSIIARLSLKEVPGKLQNILEFILESMLSMIETVTADRKKAEKFFPLVATFFMFIITANWIGLIPGFETIGRFEEFHGEEILIPYLRPPGSDLNTTIALAVISMTFVQIFGFGALGFGYLKKFFNFSNPIAFFVGVRELGKRIVTN